MNNYAVMFNQCNQWLESLQEQVWLSEPVRISSLFQIFLGRFICHSDILKFGEEIRDYIDNSNLNESFKNCDLALILITLSLMRLNQIYCRKLEQFSDNISQILLEYEDIDYYETCDLFLPRFLLYKLGKYNELSPPSEEILYIFNKNPQLIHFSKKEILSLIHKINSIAQFGQKKPFLTNESLFFLEIWMVHAFRSYDLELGASLLRTLKYCGNTKSICFYQGFEYLLSQNHPKGYFGYLARESEEIQEKDPTFNCIFDLYLPLTLICLWTIVEISQSDNILTQEIPLLNR